VTPSDLVADVVGEPDHHAVAPGDLSAGGERHRLTREMLASPLLMVFMSGPELEDLDLRPPVQAEVAMVAVICSTIEPYRMSKSKSAHDRKCPRRRCGNQAERSAARLVRHAPGNLSPVI
jgi:hypothetical protein